MHYGLLLITSFKTEKKIYSEIESPIEFSEGLWISKKDSLKGISIIKGQLAFFENMTFPGDSIYDYKVVDSISKIRNRQDKIGTYIKKMNLWDTVYVEIIDFKENLLTLKQNNDIETYRLE